MRVHFLRFETFSLDNMLIKNHNFSSEKLNYPIIMSTLSSSNWDSTILFSNKEFEQINYISIAGFVNLSNSSSKVPEAVDNKQLKCRIKLEIK